jgi:uncharacterized Tic20 family protein
LQQTIADFENNPDPRVTKDEITLGVIAHALTFVEGGIIGPLIVYLIKRKESEFVAFHALQSLYFGLLFIGVSFVSIVTCIGPAVLAIVYIVYEIIACIRASEGKWYMLPLAGKWAAGSHPVPPWTPPPQQPPASSV